jgi:hypothetical protein
MADIHLRVVATGKFIIAAQERDPSRSNVGSDIFSFMKPNSRS